MRVQLHRIIEDLNARKERALVTAVRCRSGKDINGAKQKEERAKAYSFCIQELTKILNEDVSDKVNTIN